MLIETTYKPPTDHHGSRVVARALTAGGWKRTVTPYDYALDSTRNHHTAAQACFADHSKRPRWTVPYVARPTPEGFVFIFDHSYPET